MQTTAHARVFLARHRWVYWMIVAALAAALAWSVRGQLQAVDAARESWESTTPVLVAVGDQAAGAAPLVEQRDVPTAVVPSSALRELPDGALLRQRVTDDEMLTTADVSAAPGPVAGADEHSAVVGISDPLARGATIGTRVRISAEGIVLARVGEVVSLDDELVFVAVDEDDAPMIAAAAQSGVASIIFLP